MVGPAAFLPQGRAVLGDLVIGVGYADSDANLLPRLAHYLWTFIVLDARGQRRCFLCSGILREFLSLGALLLGYLASSIGLMAAMLEILHAMLLLPGR